MVLFHSFTFSPAQWASPQLNGPVQLFYNLFWTRQLTDRAILANRRRGKKMLQVAMAPKNKLVDDCVKVPGCKCVFGTFPVALLHFAVHTVFDVDVTLVSCCRLA